MDSHEKKTGCRSLFLPVNRLVNFKNEQRQFIGTPTSGRIRRFIGAALFAIDEIWRVDFRGADKQPR